MLQQCHLPSGLYIENTFYREHILQQCHLPSGLYERAYTAGESVYAAGFVIPGVLTLCAGAGRTRTACVRVCFGACVL